MGNTIQLFNDEWMFSKQKLGTQLDEINKSTVNWDAVDIPHDWLIYDAANLYETGEGWYRKQFDMTTADTEPKYVYLRFEGIYMDSTVYVNNTFAGEWKYGYSTFELDVTDLLHEGNNEIIIRVVYQSPNSRWYSGAGIYRNVWLKTVNKNHIVSDGIYITPVKQKESDVWQVHVDTKIHTVKKENSSLILCHTIYDAEGSDIAGEQGSFAACDDSGLSDISQMLIVTNPVLWNIDTPVLYMMRTELYEDNIMIHMEETNFGFRTIEFHTDNGFMLNGKRVKIFGACQHHDLGCLGAAVNKTAIRRQFKILKEMGVNAVRTSHNMPAVELMELADEMGMLICSEAFDMWERSKTEYDYARFFNEWAAKDVKSWIERDRNHPSVIMWSIGNEIYDTHADARGQEITKMLLELVRKYDPKNHAPVTIGSNYMAGENAQKCADIIKLAGYNYSEKLYNTHHEKYPDWIIYGSETASTVQSRGIYRFPLSQSLLSDDDEQCSSLGNSTTSWGARNTEGCIIDDRDAAFSLGQFIWTGFDYIGEPTPYHTKNSYLGQIDTAGFKKDSFYIYQAEWTDYKKVPMVHIFPYWEFSENQLIDVRVCSNAPKIELFFNDESCGTFEIDHLHGKDLVGHWQLAYKKGILRAVAYNENNEVIAEDIKSSFGDAAEIVLTPDKEELLADGFDLVFIEISAKDKDGVFVENANNRINVCVEGAGRLIGLDNGDSTDFEQYKGTSRRMFSGKLLAVIGATNVQSSIKVTVSSEGLETKTFILNAVEGQIKKGASVVFQENKRSSQIAQLKEIPIRKIELSSPEGNQLNASLSSVTVVAKIYPENATYDDLEWRVTNNAGIDSNIASLVTDGRKAVITAVGDGDIYLRCAARNGSNKVRLISQLDFHITGMGTAYIDPYKFVAGGLYNASNIPLNNGNDRGVATPYNVESHVGFKELDFGDYGSDEITIPIFTLDSSDFLIDIWEGMPDEKGSEHLCTVPYTKGSIWNTYQEETYKLPKRLCGITSICFVVKRKVHIKGFVFKKIKKAYEQIEVVNNSYIYGDSFTVTEDAIEGNSITGIGNNVSIGFDNMDYEGSEAAKIKICGHTSLKANTIRIKFDDNNDTKIIEFLQSDDYVVMEFGLGDVPAFQKVTFIFLPGCRFDFKWFKFV